MEVTREIQNISEINGGIAEKCVEFGRILGLDEPVSESVLHAALSDSSYAHNLLTCRRNPAFLRHLLANPPKSDVPKLSPDEKSNVALVKQISIAMWNWSKTGFSTVEEAVFQKRFNACLECPHLTDEPDTILYKILSESSNQKICNLCGCQVSKKARLTSESCPDKHPTKNDLSRWEEDL